MLSEFVYSSAAEPLTAAPPAPPEPILSGEHTTRSAFVALSVPIAAAVAHYAQQMATSRDSTGPHQFRVSLRRLRTLARLCRPLLAPDFHTETNSGGRDLAGLAADIRRLDVAIEEMLPKAEDAVDAKALASLRRRFERAAKADAGRLQAAAATPGYLLRLHRRLLEDSWAAEGKKAQKALSQPVERWASKALEAQWRKLRALGDRLEALTDEERHELRKRGKTMRYAIAFFGSLYPEERVDALAQPIRRLQNVLGVMNDVAEAELLEQFAPEPRYAEALAAIRAYHEKRLAQQWPKAVARWQAVAEVEPFWR